MTTNPTTLAARLRELAYENAVCHCGDYLKNHRGYENHSPVAMLTPEEKAMDEAAALIEQQQAVIDRLPPIPKNLRELPEWSSDLLDDNGGLLSHGKVARVIGELGLNFLQARNAAAGEADNWPVGNWDGLVESSRWMCVRSGLELLARAAEAARVGKE